MSEPAMLADHIDEQTEAILANWREAVERVGDVPESERLSHADFMDHVPALLDRLAERLRGHSSDAAMVGKKHGQHRWRHGYGIGEVVREIGHLRNVLSRATTDFAQGRDWDVGRLAASIEAINEVLDEATAESVRQFQEDGQAQTHAALAEVKTRQSAVEDAWIVAKAEQSKLRTILRNLPAGVWVVDADGLVLGVNNEAERIQGFVQQKTHGRSHILELAAPEQLAHTDGMPIPAEELPVFRALRGETVVQQELAWIVHGAPRTVSMNAVPLTDSAGAITGAVVVALDLTLSRQAEEQFRRQLDLSRTITETVGEGLCTVDAEGRVTYANPALVELVGWTAEELAGRDLHATIHARHLDGTVYPFEECPLSAVLRRGETIRGDEVYYRKDGSSLHAAFTASPIRVEGRVTGAVQVIRDITKRKELEASLAESEARFRVIAEKSPVMIWRTDASGACDYLNQVGVAFRGEKPPGDSPPTWPENLHPDDRERCLGEYQAAFATRAPFELTYRSLRGDGQYRWVCDRGAPYFDARDGFLGFLGSCLDITARIELEKSLEQQREMAEEASRHKTRLVSALSHDARTPLNAVVLAAQLLEIHIGDSQDPEVRECLRTIRHSVRNVLDLLGDLLNLSKIDAGAMPAEVSRFPLEPVLAECLASVETQARIKGLDIHLDPGPLANASLETDRSKLKQILANLLSNALRYTENGSIRIRGEQTDDQVRIAVEDTGTGIAPADQGRIFDEFAMLDNGQRPPGEGTGLGLAICRRLASLLKGEIALRSALGQGSTFTLVLPISVLTLSLPKPERPEAPAPPGSNKGAILVAEDHVDSRQTLSRVLRRMGYRVLEAGNGRDALAIIREESLIAVLMDVNMPVMDGVEATLEIRSEERFRDLPIFALTGDVTLVNQHRIGKAGVNGYLEKPVTWDVLKQALGSLGDGRKYQEPF